jgi:DNA-binding transcriptional ArsR family regulator
LFSYATRILKDRTNHFFEFSRNLSVHLISNYLELSQEVRMPDVVEQNASRFMALGNPIRLAILRLVVQGHEAGTPAGSIQEQLGIPASTLSHHLACLAETGLVNAEREGTTLRYRPDFPALRRLTEYLWEDCCKGGRSEGPCTDTPGCCLPRKPRVSRS